VHEGCLTRSWLVSLAASRVSTSSSFCPICLPPPTTALVSARATVRDGERETLYTRSRLVEVGVLLSFDV
jgi:hypothetical protein